MSEAAQTLRFGVLGKPHGLQGKIVLRVFNAARDRVRGLPVPVEVILVGPGVSERRMVDSVRAAGSDFVVGFTGVRTPEQAARLTNLELFVPRLSLPPLSPGEYYVQDLVGCTVFDLQGRSLGVVATTLWNGAHDIITVEDQTGGERLFPVVPEFIREVSIALGRIVVDAHEEP